MGFGLLAQMRDYTRCSLLCQAAASGGALRILWHYWIIQSTRDESKDMSLENDPEKFLKRYSYLRKWVDECIVCHHKGYRPDTPYPERKTKYSTHAQLRRLFDELVLDESGMCEQCRSVKQ